jgi:hypothetical protein
MNKPYLSYLHNIEQNSMEEQVYFASRTKNVLKSMKNIYLTAPPSWILT